MEVWIGAVRQEYWRNQALDRACRESKSLVCLDFLVLGFCLADYGFLAWV